MARRAAGLLLAFALLGLLVVYLRAEQTRVASQTLQLEEQWVALRRDLWEVQTHVARLRTPEQVHQRLDLFAVEVTEPEAEAQDLIHAP